MIRLRYYGEMRTLAGCPGEALEAASLAAVQVYLQERYGAGVTDCIRRCHIFVNGEEVLKTAGLHLQPGDVVSFITAAAGG